MITTEGRTAYMPAVPGIVVADRAPAETARILGTGIEVWEVIKTFLEVGSDWGELLKAYHWLTDKQLTAAMEYARQHPAEIDARIQEDYAYLPAALRPDPDLHWR